MFLEFVKPPVVFESGTPASGVFINKTIILLHSFLKKTSKTPKKEIGKAEESYKDVVNNKKIYE